MSVLPFREVAQRPPIALARRPTFRKGIEFRLRGSPDLAVIIPPLSYEALEALQAGVRGKTDAEAAPFVIEALLQVLGEQYHCPKQLIEGIRMDRKTVHLVLVALLDDGSVRSGLKQQQHRRKGEST